MTEQDLIQPIVQNQSFLTRIGRAFDEALARAQQAEV
jgi:hypothetical protein